MVAAIEANASPEKRLFISLITRDIPLAAAFLDLIDNSINAAVEPFADTLKTASDYTAILDNSSIEPSTEIRLSFSGTTVEISDNAPGIKMETARDHVFKFGRSSSDTNVDDRLSVYGIGLKRAMFKLGNKICIVSDHVDGGFSLDLDVTKWSKIQAQPWFFEIFSRKAVEAKSCGTKIVISELYEETRRRLTDGLFAGQIKELIAKTYAFYIAKFVHIYVGEVKVEAVNLQIGENHSTEELTIGAVSCRITAGIGIPESGGFRDKSSGWFVLCNGRSVISADKTLLTGWGGGGALPIFQPKHRPFLGTVYFVCNDAEKLPWTTTKSAINEDSEAWQEAKKHMIVIGRSVTSFLDSRYTDEGTGVASSDLQKTAGKPMNVVTAASQQKRVFSPPPTTAEPKTSRIQYDADVGEIKKIAKHLRKPSMGGAEVGRYTFSFFLKNEVGD